MKNRITKNKLGQEEMVGFALIIVVVTVILIALLAFYIKKPDSTSSAGNPQVNSFIQSFLQYTTTCEQSSENITLQSLIFKCQDKEICLNGASTCKALNDTLKGIIQESWKVGPTYPVKGYNLIIMSTKGQVLNLTGGVVTNNYKGSEQDFGKGEEFITILFNAYS
jgi:hypothetical protein